MTLGCSFLTICVPGDYGYVFNIVAKVCSFIVNRSIGIPCWTRFLKRFTKNNELQCKFSKGKFIKIDKIKRDQIGHMKKQLSHS